MDKNVVLPRTALSTPPATLRGRAAASVAGKKGLMFFLLRMAFWLSIVLVLLPTGSAQHEPAVNNVSAPEAISAASDTVRDLRSFCTREPDACSVGSQMAIQIGYKMQAGAKLIYDFLTTKRASRESDTTSGNVESRGTSKIVFDKSWSLRGSQDTLTPADLAPAWRGPSAHKGGKPAA